MPLQFPNLGAAIGVAEGFGIAGTIPTLANNPGDIVYGPFAITHGATGIPLTASNGQLIARFPDVATGRAAEDALISGNYAGGSIRDLAAGWLAGSSKKAQDDWAATVAGKLGVTPDTPVLSAEAGGAAVIGGQVRSTSSILDSVLSAPQRIIVAVVGFIVLAGALYLFKPEAVTAAVKTGAKAAAI